MNSEGILKAQRMQNQQGAACASLSGIGSALPSISGATNLASQLQQPRKYIGEQITQANGALLDLFDSIETLSGRLSAVTDAPCMANECSPDKAISAEPAFVTAMDSIVERINVARELIANLTERVRV